MIYSTLFLLILLAYVLLDATAQGKLTALTRRYVPPTEQAAVNLPLHYLYPACYALLAGAIALHAGPWWLVVAGLLRLALFDVVLNQAKGDPPFAVGSSAAFDKLLVRVAGGRAPLLSAAVRVAAGVLTGGAVWLAACNS